MTTPTQHTHGPWMAAQSLRHDWHIGTRTHGEAGICSVSAYVMHPNERQQQETAANARLIAAAPDLLSALEAMLPLACDGIDARDRDAADNADEGQRIIDSARAAIAKARGTK